MELELTELESQIDHQFQDHSFLETALTHKSFVYEQTAKTGEEVSDNERLEYLGDAVLELIISEYLMELFPEKPEGELSRLRAAVVNEGSLAEIAKRVGIQKFIRLGRGEELSEGREKPSILADAYEALVAAIFRDAGFEEARRVIRGHFSFVLMSVHKIDRTFDFKTRLQELCQRRFKEVPVYRVIREEGPDHRKEFYVEVILREERLAIGNGRSKKEAEQVAASLALQGVEEDEL